MTTKCEARDVFSNEDFFRDIAHCEQCGNNFARNDEVIVDGDWVFCSLGCRDLLYEINGFPIWGELR